MRTIAALIFVALLAPTTLLRGQSDSTQNYDVRTVANSEAQKLLTALIPEHKKFVVIKPFVVSTERRDVDLGTTCSSSSSGTVSGSVDDSGDVKGTTQASGATHCREQHNYYATLKLGLADESDPKAIYIITTQCVERWVWDHCAMPEKGQVYPVVLEQEKHGTFDVYAATTERLGGKEKVAKFAVLGVEHLKTRDASNAAAASTQ